MYHSASRKKRRADGYLLPDSWSESSPSMGKPAGASTQARWGLRVWLLWRTIGFVLGGAWEVRFSYTRGRRFYGKGGAPGVHSGGYSDQWKHTLRVQTRSRRVYNRGFFSTVRPTGYVGMQAESGQVGRFENARAQF
ncbi:hypothetical protein SS50377_26219 [Spironucleus salmonicida]|uniref:Uncharacterized protein n=1 Tax=Spironucleus salmonicida TaxID=348837 RepID=A0A9P8LPR8_9EUKA|nr:hypothetical protein SS50377_26219 [Spironucleus salmonicida]